MTDEEQLVKALKGATPETLVKILVRLGHFPKKIGVRRKAVRRTSKA